MTNSVNSQSRNSINLGVVLGAFVFVIGAGLFVADAQQATQIAGRVVDGAGRPVEGVEIKVSSRYPGIPHLVQSYGDFKAGQCEIACLSTDKEGNFHTTIDSGLESLTIAIGKKSYVGFIKAAPLALGKGPLIIYRSVGCREVKIIGTSNGNDSLRSSLLDILASDEFELPFNVSKDCDFVSELFQVNQRIRPVAASLVDNRAILLRTAKLLSYFANVEDRQQLLAMLEALNDLKNLEINEVRRVVVGGLISPTSENEWKLLESIITCEKRYADRDNPIDIPVEEAALALAANGSARALSILKIKSQLPRPPRFESVVKLAIRWIEKHPGPVESYSDLKSSIQSAARVFNYSGSPNRLRVDKTVKDRLQQKALVYCTVDTGGEQYFYELVFERTDDKWILRGLWPAGVAD